MNTKRTVQIAGSLVLTAAVLAGGSAASAAIVSNVDTTTDNATLTSWPSTTDLLQTQVTSSSLTDYTPTSSVTGNSADILRDGSVGTGIDLSYPTSLIEASDGSAADGWTAEYSFDVSTNTAGYTITSIASISSIQFGDLDKQSFDIFVHLVGADANDWVEIGDGFTGNATPDGGVRVTITDDETGVIASGVDGLRFVSTGGLRGTYRELDVIGAPTPEPGSMSLMLLGAAMVMRRRRRTDA